MKKQTFLMAVVVSLFIPKFSSAVGGGCAKINLPIPSNWTPTNYHTGATVGSDGWINGKNLYNDKEKAMYFDASATPYTTSTHVSIKFGKAYSSTPTIVVPIKFYDGSSGSPGALLFTKNITMGQIMSDVQNGNYTEIDFENTPVTLPASKKFFVSVDVTNLTWAGATHDTLNIFSNTTGETTPSAIWDKNSANTWQQYNTGTTWALNASLLIHPWLTNGSSTSSFIQNKSTICPGDSISFNGIGSSSYDNLYWHFPGAMQATSNDTTPVVVYNSPGTFDAILYTVGGCYIDSSFVSITVNANPSVTVSSTATAFCIGGNSTLTASGASTYTWAPQAGLNMTNGDTVIASPIVPTTYSVIGTDANGCMNTAIKTITVNQLPTLSAGSDLTICSGSSVIIGESSEVDHAYSWTSNPVGFTSSSSNPTISPTVATSYYAVKTNTTTACETKDTVVVSLKSTSSSSETETTCDTYTWPTNSQTYTLSGTYTATLTNVLGCDSVVTLNLTINPTPLLTTSLNGVTIAADETSATYQWINCSDSSAISGETAQTYTATTNGDYAVIVTKNNCSDTSACVSVNTIGVAQFQVSSSLFQVYPNPNSGTFILRTNNSEHRTIAIANALGEIVYSENIQSSQSQIQLPELVNGIYFITLNNTNQQVKEKLVIYK